MLISNFYFVGIVNKIMENIEGIKEEFNAVAALYLETYWSQNSKDSNIMSTLDTNMRTIVRNTKCSAKPIEEYNCKECVQEVKAFFVRMTNVVSRLRCYAERLKTSLEFVFDPTYYSFPGFSIPTIPRVEPAYVNLQQKQKIPEKPCKFVAEVFTAIEEIQRTSRGFPQVVIIDDSEQFIRSTETWLQNYNGILKNLIFVYNAEINLSYITHAMKYAYHYNTYIAVPNMVYSISDIVNKNPGASLEPENVQSELSKFKCPFQSVSDQQSVRKPSYVGGNYLVDPNSIQQQHMSLLGQCQTIYTSFPNIIKDLENACNRAQCSSCNNSSVMNGWNRVNTWLPGSSLSVPLQSNYNYNFLFSYANFVALIKYMKGRMIQQNNSFPGYELPPDITIRPTPFQQQPLRRQSMQQYTQQSMQQSTQPYTQQSENLFFIDHVFSQISKTMKTMQTAPVILAILPKYEIKVMLDLNFIVTIQTVICVYNADILETRDDFNFDTEFKIYDKLRDHKLKPDIFIATPRAIYWFSRGYQEVGVKLFKDNFDFMRKSNIKDIRKSVRNFRFPTASV